MKTAAELQELRDRKQQELAEFYAVNTNVLRHYANLVEELTSLTAQCSLQLIAESKIKIPSYEQRSLLQPGKKYNVRRRTKSAAGK